jgi:hypothetical protein
VTRLWLVLVLALFGLAGACGQERHTMAPGATFDDKAKLVVELERSPTGGAAFDFCPTANELHLRNAAWLAFLSANEYSHLFYLSTLLRELGFAAPGGGLDWPTCATDLRVMRGFEDESRAPLVAAERAKALRTFLEPYAAGWGACARAWFATYDGSTFPAPSFEKYLIQTAHPGEHVEFFSGGKITDHGRVFASGSTQVTFARHGTLPLVIIAFRGTEPTKWSDIVTDLKVWKTSLAPDWGEVHSGFRAAFDSVAPLLRAKLDELSGQSASESKKVGIWVTGHSLGGALATLMAAEILRRAEAGAPLELRGVYTYGSPRVGDKAFRARLAAAAAKHGTHIVRFRNGNDIVTAMPRVLEFEHVGRVAHLHEDRLDVGDQDPPYAGLGSLADHDIIGWARPRKSVSGYYRRILARGGDQPGRCEPTAP